MTREERIFEMLKVIAPIMVQRGNEMQDRLQSTSINGKSIVELYAKGAVQWAEAIVDADN